MHPVNNPSTPLVLSSRANDSRPLQCQQEMALFYGIERKKRREIKREARERRGEKKGDEAKKKGPSGNMV